MNVSGRLPILMLLRPSTHNQMNPFQKLCGYTLKIVVLTMLVPCALVGILLDTLGLGSLFLVSERTEERGGKRD
jgi:hypothetical protein